MDSSWRFSFISRYIGLASCDADQNPFNGCFDTDTFATPTPDCSGIPGGDLIVDSCGDCVAEEVDSDGDGFADTCDTCPGFDDNLDSDNDELADDCDVCPNDAANDADQDGVCGDVDACEGFDDSLDTDSDGVPNNCDDAPDGDIVLTWLSDSESHATLSYESNVNIHGFQLTVNGVDLTDSFDGVLDVYFSENTQNLVAFSMDGQSLPAGEGTLITFEFII